MAGSIFETINNLHPNAVSSGPINLFGSALNILSDTSEGKSLYSIKPRFNVFGSNSVLSLMT